MCPTSHVQFVSSQIMIATQKLPCFRRFNQHPKTVHEGLKDRNWVQAMKEEMSALEKNETCKMVARPKVKKAVGCRWVYTLKCKADGTLERYKARLLANG